MSEDKDQSTKTAIETSRELLRELEQAGATYLESPAKVVARLSRYTGVYPVRNLAVDLCDQMFAESAQQALKEGKSPQVAKAQGKVAFCATLPKLAGADNIRDFIACIIHGMAIGIIPGNEGTRLLYGAQVAHMARTKRPKKRNKSSHTNTKETPATPKESIQ
jgi:hypothetical protein